MDKRPDATYKLKNNALFAFSNLLKYWANRKDYLAAFLYIGTEIMGQVKRRHEHVYIQTNDDPRKRSRTLPMEVLSLGMSRTGTMSS